MMIESPHHRHSMRLKGYDYARPRAYFVTVVVHNRDPLFCEIIDSDARFSKIGEMIRQEWLRLERRFPNVRLDVFIIIPNHIRGIIILNESHRGCATTNMLSPASEYWHDPWEIVCTRAMCTYAP